MSHEATRPLRFLRCAAVPHAVAARSESPTGQAEMRTDIHVGWLALKTAAA